MARSRTLKMVLLLGILALFLVPLTVVHAAGKGTVTFSDGKGASDTITISMSGVADPGAGKVLVGWLINDDSSKKTNTGALTLKEGVATGTYSDPANANLLATYSSFAVTVETSGTVAAPSATVAYSGAINKAGRTEVRALLVAVDTNPDKKGAAVGYRQQATLALTHANLGLAQAKAGNLTGAKTHSEHVVNIIEGSKGAKFGDLDKDGTTGNPGDGIGVLAYGADVIKRANAAQTAGAGDDVLDMYAPMAAGSVNGAESEIALARDTAISVFNTTDPNIASLYLTNVVALLTKGINGVDVNGDGIVDANATEGGVNQAYWSAQKMAMISVAVPPKTPVTGDIGYGTIALIALAGGLVLFTGGAFLYRRSRARA